MNVVHGNFRFTETKIPGVLLVDTKYYGDDRGGFMETWRQDALDASGVPYRFVQANQSISSRGVLRGLHLQKCYPQVKLVRVVLGEVFDVAVDLRPHSPTYGQWVGVRLSGENRRQLLIPRGLAHGFQVLSERAVFAYQCDEYYHPEDEGGVRFDDPDIGICWPLPEAPRLSAKDALLPSFQTFSSQLNEERP